MKKTVRIIKFEDGTYGIYDVARHCDAMGVDICFKSFEDAMSTVVLNGWKVEA